MAFGIRRATIDKLLKDSILSQLLYKRRCKDSLQTEAISYSRCDGSLQFTEIQTYTKQPHSEKCGYFKSH